MDVVGAVMTMKGLLALIAGVIAIIFLGNLILGGTGRQGESGDDREDGDEWAGEGDAGEDEDAGQMDVLVATRALIVADPYAGRHLYVELDDGDVVHLCGRWLDDYHVGGPAASFPCERFRPYADFPDDPFDLEHPYRVECLGLPITPLVASEPLDEEARRDGLAPADWARLPVSFDKLLRRLGPDGGDAPRRPAVTSEQLAALEDALHAPAAGRLPFAENASPESQPGSPSAALVPAEDDPRPGEDDVTPRADALTPPDLAASAPTPDGPIFSTSRSLDAPEELETPEDEPPRPDDEVLPPGGNG